MADIEYPLARIRLETSKGHFVSDTAIIAASPLPDVVVWGLRTFLKHDERKAVYREVYAVYALDDYNFFSAKMIAEKMAVPPLLTPPLDDETFPPRTLITSQDQIPDFDKMTREEEADWWDAHDLDEQTLVEVSEEERAAILNGLSQRKTSS